ncbi:hypothetical protein ACTFIW_008873 [Dictyostelium discoideum]
MVIIGYGNINSNNTFKKRTNGSFKCFKCGKEGRIARYCKVTPVRFQSVNAVFNDSIPVQHINNERKVTIESEDQLRYSHDNQWCLPKFNVDSGADINIIPKAALTMGQWKSREESNVKFTSACGNSIQSLGSIALVLEIPTVSNKTAAIAAKFEISDDVVVIILGHPSGTKLTLWT